MSARKASISSGVGGRPIRSKVARRSSVRRSAGAAGVRPFACNCWRMKASTGLRVQADEGVRARGHDWADESGRNDQNCRSSSVMPLVRTATAPPPGQGAPWATHFLSTAIWSAVSLSSRRHLDLMRAVDDGDEQALRRIAGERARARVRRLAASRPDCRAGATPSVSSARGTRNRTSPGSAALRSRKTPHRRPAEPHGRHGTRRSSNATNRIPFLATNPAVSARRIICRLSSSL